ncbi:MAG: hypothetical protein ABIV50_05950 [Opitutus sp.]
MPDPSHSSVEAGPNPAHHWRQYFGKTQDAGHDIDLPLSPAGSSRRESVGDHGTERVVLFRFDDDVVENPNELGHRILFSAREEDEHPDLVGTEDFG